MLAGFAKIDITPKFPVNTIYTKTPEAIAKEIKSKLYARVSVFQHNENQIVLISVDLLGLDSGFTGNIKKALIPKGINPENVMISCTHTHTAPNTINFNGFNDKLKKEDKYIKGLEKNILQAVDEACTDLDSAEIRSGSSNVDLNVNRREKGRMADINNLNAEPGLVDQTFSMIFVRQKKSNKEAVLLNYTAHPLSMGKESSRAISADYPGELCDILESGDYKFAQFFQGGAGNINIKISGGIHISRKVGEILADAVLQEKDSLIIDKEQCVSMKTQEILMPVDNITMLLNLDKQKDISNEVEDEWRKKALSKEKQQQKRVPVLIQHIKLGDTYIAALPGEQFVETGLIIRKHLSGRNCFIVAYANCDEIGYIPTKGSFLDGGYEVEVAYKYYGDFVYRCAPEAANCFVDNYLKICK